MRKPVNLAEAVEQVPNGAIVMIGGFMGVGTPPRLIDETVRQGKKDLTIMVNDTARPGVGVGKLIDAGLVRKVIASHIGTNPVTQRLMLRGEVEVELVPQGTLIERIRAGGFGLGGVLTPTGVGTLVQDGKQTVEVDGRTFLLEKPITANFAYLYATQADYLGNLAYSLTARNFNPLMAMAATVVMVESQSIVPVGVIPPDAVMTPAVLVKCLIAKERHHG
jgi:acetate CoA/acetoacetate CoA-transferase alpha subunit